MKREKLFTFIFGTVVVQGLIILAAFVGFSNTPSLSKTLEDVALVLPLDETLESTLETEITEDSFTAGSTQSFIQTSANPISELPTLLENNEVPPFAYTVKQGDTLSGIWKEIGADVEQVHAAAKAFKEADVALSSLRAGETLEVTVDLTGQIQSFKKPLRDGKTLVLTSLKDGEFEPEIVHPQIVETERTVTGEITSSLAESSVRENIPYEVVDEFVDLFGGRVEFSREVQPGDSFTVIYNERHVKNGEQLSAGHIDAASFMNKGELLVAIRYDTPGGPTYFDQKGKPLGNHFLRYPVKYTRISSMFTKARFHPVLKRMRPHNGVDFAAPTGTPVRTVADGVVIESSYHRGNGNWVKIQHGDKYATAYLHLSKISKGVRKGARVKRGQVIGAVGSTGMSTGPHLHYSFYVHGKYVDPMRVKLPHLPEKFHPIPEKFLKATLKKLRRRHRGLKLASATTVSEKGRA